MNIDQKMFRMMMLGQTLRKVSIEGMKQLITFQHSYLNG